MENVGKEVSYPFGYGLSYTTFEYGKPSANLVNGVYKVNVEVRNSGNVAGREVVELYAASSSWVVAGGNWNFLVGASSRDIRSSVEVNVKASSSQVGDFFKSDRPLNLLTR